MKSSWCCQVFWSFFIEMLLCLCLLSTKYCFFEKLQLTLISFSFKLFSMNSLLAAFFNVLKPDNSVLLFPWFYRHSYMSFFPPSYLQHISLWRHFPADYLTPSIMWECCSEGIRTFYLLLLSFPSTYLMLLTFPLPLSQLLSGSQFRVCCALPWFYFVLCFLPLLLTR